MANSVDENQIGDKNYQWTRSLAALAFYRKAACHPTLNPIIQSILFHERATGLSPIADVLVDFELWPCTTTYEPTNALRARLVRQDPNITLADSHELPKKIDYLDELMSQVPVRVGWKP
jgi:hypothetical protein